MSNARDGLYRRGDSSTWWMSYVDARGKRVRRSTGKKNKMEAQAVLEKARVKAADGELPAQGKATVKALAQKYLKAQEARGLRAVKRKREYVSVWIVPTIGHVKLRQLGQAHVEEMWSSMADAGRAPATRNRALSTLQHMISWACRQDGVCPMSTRDRLRAVRKLEEPPERDRHLSPREAERLLKYLEEPLRSIVLFALYTGARLGEIIGNRSSEPLRWDEVDLEGGFIKFARTKSGKVRSVPIAEPLREVLDDLPRRIDCPWVFYHPGKKAPTPLTWSALKRDWSEALDSAKIRDFRFHDLRHTAASWMAQAGVPLYTIGKVLGHSTSKVTERYSHLHPDHLRSATEALSSRFRHVSKKSGTKDE